MSRDFYNELAYDRMNWILIRKYGDETLMKNADFYGLVNIEYPDDYIEMSTEEISKYFKDNALRWGGRSPEKHVILSLGKTKDSFFNLFYDAKSALTGGENVLKKTLKDYERLERFDTTLLGNAAMGVHFEYTADDKPIRQFCELVVVRIKKCFYTVYCISWAENAAENAAVFENFRTALKLV